MICFELSNEEWKTLNTALYHAADAYNKEGIHYMSENIETVRAKIEDEKKRAQGSLSIVT